MSDRVDMTPEDPRTPEELAAAHPEVPPPWAGEPTEEHVSDPGIEAEPEPVTEEEVATWLERVGRLINASWRATAGFLFPKAAKAAPFAWLFSVEELEVIPPPLTRVINRRFGWLRGVIRNADELELGFRLEEYVRVNITIIRAAEAGPEREEPATGAEELPEGHPDRGPAGFGLEP